MFVPPMSTPTRQSILWSLFLGNDCRQYTEIRRRRSGCAGHVRHSRTYKRIQLWLNQNDLALQSSEQDGSPVSTHGHIRPALEPDSSPSAAAKKNRPENAPNTPASKMPSSPPTSTLCSAAR